MLGGELFLWRMVMSSNQDELRDLQYNTIMESIHLLKGSNESLHKMVVTNNEMIARIVEAITSEKKNG